VNLNESEAKSMRIRYRCQHCYKEFEGQEEVYTCEVCGNHGGLFEIGRSDGAVPGAVPETAPATVAAEEELKPIPDN